MFEQDQLLEISKVAKHICNPRGNDSRYYANGFYVDPANPANAIFTNGVAMIRMGDFFDVNYCGENFYSLKDLRAGKTKPLSHRCPPIPKFAPMDHLFSVEVDSLLSVLKAMKQSKVRTVSIHSLLDVSSQNKAAKVIAVQSQNPAYRVTGYVVLKQNENPITPEPNVVPVEKLAKVYVIGGGKK